MGKTKEESIRIMNNVKRRVDDLMFSEDFFLQLNKEVRKVMEYDITYTEDSDKDYRLAKMILYMALKELAVQYEKSSIEEKGEDDDN